MHTTQLFIENLISTLNDVNFLRRLTSEHIFIPLDNHFLTKYNNIITINNHNKHNNHLGNSNPKNVF